ncbi:hypothetical protein [Methanosphaera cuniculi]|uniref:hypothetical protein n=1 Tax=Methanosphaera cuniculi TaxID=1077256 RepID=UPI0026F239DC|nr:hypothetical protein [Methanosphaera cuniculi]
MKFKKILLVSLFAAILLTSTVSAGLFDLGSDSNNERINVTDLNIKSQGYSMYEVTCNLVPKENFTYLEMQVNFYDSDNAVIGKDSMVWNINNPVEGETIKVSGTAMTDSSSTTPARAEVYFYDEPLSDTPENALYHETVNMTN